MRSLGTHKSNFLAVTNADMIAGLRSCTLPGHPDDAVRLLMLSERLRNLRPRLRSSKAFLSSDLWVNHSNEAPIRIPVKKTSANLNQGCWPSATRLLETFAATALGSEKKFSPSHFSRLAAIRGISRRPQIPNRNGLSHLDMDPLLVSTLTQPSSPIKGLNGPSF